MDLTMVGDDCDDLGEIRNLREESKTMQRVATPGFLPAHIL